MDDELDGPGLAEHWGLDLDTLGWIETKAGPRRLGFAAQLRHYALTGRFAESAEAIPPAAARYLAEQTGRPVDDLDGYDWAGRSAQRHRAEILRRLAIRPIKSEDLKALSIWLEVEVCPRGETLEAMVAEAHRWCLARGHQAPSPSTLGRLARAARRRFEDALLVRLTEGLSPTAVAALEATLAGAGEGPSFTALKADPGRVALESLLGAADRLAFLRGLGLPRDALAGVAAPVIERLRRRVAQENGWEMRRHPPARRLGLLALYLLSREAALVDGLVDLLIETVHKIGVRAERRVLSALTGDIERVDGKEQMLVALAEAAIDRPDEPVRIAIFPVASEAKLRAVVSEHRARGSWDRQVQTTMRRSYAGHYRRMLPRLLDLLTFRSNNATHRPVLDALERVGRARASRRRVLHLREGLVLDGVVPVCWRPFLIEGEGKEARIGLVDYEICVLKALRERLRAKEVWVVGADRYRNPDKDLPADFETRRDLYYADLGLSQDAAAFTAELRAEMATALTGLDAALPELPNVGLRWSGRNRIRLSRPEPQPDPPGLTALKAEVLRRWPMTALIDVLKEVALDTGLLDAFATSGERVVLDAETLQRRLILCLYGLGTNAGLKRVAAGTEGVSYKELLHIRRRFVHVEALRTACARVSSAIFGLRDPSIWGEAGTACASDSKKFGAWDRNLMTEWHVRYGGRGVMIYWHVERGSTCVYSQLKRCSSSEAAAMIEGVLRHCTDMEIQRQYVDSHGQSEVAFAFCRLLGFELAPRLKAIARQRLYLPEAAMRAALPNLMPILSDPIDWALIERQYDEMVKHAAAMRHRTADAEAILRRFARTEVMHPTYKALAELGRAVKTLFLCRYLGSAAFRSEIHEGLNTVETWNSANGFVFFGKGGEIATNRLEDQEVAMLALHLVQNCLVYVNTRMLQSVLGDGAWAARMTREDHRALSPLGHAHINPYGRFEIDLGSRVDFAAAA